jgi:hypothetical protein
VGQQGEFCCGHPDLPDGSAIVTSHCRMGWARNEIKTLQEGMSGAKYLCDQTAWNKIVNDLTIFYIFKHERLCTYRIMFRCVRITIFAVEKQEALKILSVCPQP